MILKEELKYSKSHEWVALDGDSAVVGLTDYAQSELGDLVFVNLPEVGDTVEAGEVFGDVESVKAVSDVYSPVTGEVTEINEELLDSPELINDDAYEAWFIKVKDVSATEELLTAEEYKAGHIEGSINVPLQNIGSIKQLIENLSAPIYTYCLSGARSRQAAAALEAMGYKKVINIGGIGGYRGKIVR